MSVSESRPGSSATASSASGTGLTGAQTKAFNVRRLGGKLTPEVHYRVYFAPGGLFFIRIGGERKTIAYRRLGLIGLLINWLQNRKEDVDETISELESRSLKDRLDDHKANFRAAFTEIQWAKIEPKTFWGGHGKHHGRMAVKFADHGRKQFEFDDVDQMKIAVAELPQVLGPDRLKVNVQWNEAKKKFVKRRKQ